jgi:hypothetical protein
MGCRLLVAKTAVQSRQTSDHQAEAEAEGWQVNPYEPPHELGTSTNDWDLAARWCLWFIGHACIIAGGHAFFRVLTYQDWISLPFLFGLSWGGVFAVIVSYPARRKTDQFPDENSDT